VTCEKESTALVRRIKKPNEEPGTQVESAINPATRSTIAREDKIKEKERWKNPNCNTTPPLHFNCTS
jgi:hypothetical protein